MQQIATASQASPLLHSHVARLLLHPLLIRGPGLLPAGASTIRATPMTARTTELHKNPARWFANWKAIVPMTRARAKLDQAVKAMRIRCAEGLPSLTARITLNAGEAFIPNSCETLGGRNSSQQTSAMQPTAEGRNGA